MAKENHDKLITNLVLIGAGFFLVKPMLEKLGLLKDDQQKIEDQVLATVVSGNYWSPKFYLIYNNPAERVKKLLPPADITALAKQIYNAWGIINDDEDAIFDAFNKLKNKLQVSQLVDKYSQLYKQNLLTRLKNPWYYQKDGLDEKEFLEIAKIVNKLPVNLY